MVRCFVEAQKPPSAGVFGEGLDSRIRFGDTVSVLFLHFSQSSFRVVSLRYLLIFLFTLSKDSVKIQYLEDNRLFCLKLEGLLIGIGLVHEDK